MSLAELLAKLEGEYGRLIEVVKGLTPEQLERKVRIPVFKEPPWASTSAGWQNFTSASISST